MAGAGTPCRSDRQGHPARTRSGGCVGTTVIGITGAFLGGWLSAELLDRPVQRDFFDAATWASAIAGALVLPIAYRLLFGNSRE